MFGCHNCNHDPKKYENYEKSPCATCRTRKNPPALSKYHDDPATFSSLRTEHPSCVLPEEMAELPEYTKEKLFVSLAKTVQLLISMKEKYPETFKFVNAKISEPSLSYSQLAERFSCKKQNVLYHLRKAVNMYPELSVAIIVDTRFSRGFRALKRSENKNNI